MNALIIYDSLYGNTEKIARIISLVLLSKYEVAVVKVGKTELEMLKGIDLLVVGSPTQQFRATEAMRKWLDSIPPGGLTGLQAATFDTRLTQAFIDQHRVLSFFQRFTGYAAEKLAKALTKRGAMLLLPPEAFYVEGMEGPLVAGEEERARSWGMKLCA